MDTIDIYNFLNILFKKEYSSYFGFQQNMLKNPDGWQVEEINEKLAPYFWRTSRKFRGSTSRFRLYYKGYSFCRTTPPCRNNLYHSPKSISSLNKNDSIID